MREEIVSYEVAKLAKEVGFDAYCQFYYIDLEDGHRLEGVLQEFKSPYTNGILREKQNLSGFIAPEQSLLQKWIRDVHNLHIYIDTTAVFDSMQPSKYKCLIKVPFQPFKWTTGHYYLGETYEEALEKGLKVALGEIRNRLK